ncbi:MAG: RDD family protein [Chlorobiaceae bacterium]|nr:RDD family protein [Chlorobiaceae bacterium]
MSEESTRAGLLVRTVAKILDFIIIAAAAEIVPKAGFYAGLAYLLIGDGLFGGKSLGKRLVGLRVVSAVSQKPCTIRDSIIRNSIFGVGYLFSQILWYGWVFVLLVSVFEFVVLIGNKDRMRLGDEMAKTLVLDISRTEEEE